MQFALLSFFISKEESNLPSRTNEVVRCEERLLASCRGENTSLPSFLVHSFNEVGNKGLSAVASLISLMTNYPVLYHVNLLELESTYARAKIVGTY